MPTIRHYNTKIRFRAKRPLKPVENSVNSERFLIKGGQQLKSPSEEQEKVVEKDICEHDQVGTSSR